MGQKLSNKDIFISKSKKIHGDKYNYDNVNYIKGDIKVEIFCKEHGSFNQLPGVHIRGSGCYKCGIEKQRVGTTKTTENYIKKCNLVHGNKYDYSKTVYTHSNDKIIITCPTHGDFEQRASHHAEGNCCQKCSSESGANKNRLTTKDFIEKSINIHGNKYDYSNVHYKGIYEKVNIICKKHGLFKQVATNHLVGKGCNLCALENNIGGWTRTNFRTLCNQDNKKACLYLVNLKSNTTNENFYKIGITSRNVEEQIKDIEYESISILEYVHKNSDIIYNLEKELHRILKHQKYIPTTKFGGYTECFNYCDEVLQTFKNKIQHETSTFSTN